MQNKVQLYIKNDSGNYDRVDLYSNESIELTSKIQDLKDISKVFTDFSKSFNVPASETNNKIFKHFYDFNITNGYDARKKKEALIEINHLPFREGKIFLVGVKMRDNKPFTYNIQFYGKTITIKDLFGDDELSELTYLSNYNHEYSETNIRNGFTTGLNLNNQTESIIYPLITSKKRLYFHSGTPSYNADGNIYHNEAGTPDQDRGLKHTDLKPAIKTFHIIEAIESQYNIEFTRDFFSNSNDIFSNLYFWINRKKGEYNEIESDEDYVYSHTITGYTSSNPSSLVTVNGSELTVNLVDDVEYDFRLNVTVSDQTIDYEVILKNKTKNQEFKKRALGNENIAISFLDVQSTSFDVFEWEIKSRDELTISSADFTIAYSYPLQSAIQKTYSTSTNETTVFGLFVNEKMPKIKVIDFLTGLFKMFNLTAYYINDLTNTDYGKIYVDTLDNFYADAINNPLNGLINIDKYLDIKDHEVNSTLPFTDIKFEYEKTETVLMENHFEKYNEIFGNAEFNVRRRFPNKIDRGTKYNVKLPFSHLKYERLIDLNTSSAAPTNNTLIQWGYSAGGDFDPNPDATPVEKGDYSSVLIKPLLFYAIKEENLPQADINANANRSGKINWISTTPPTGITSYWRPSNSNEAGTPTVAPKYTINFDNELDEWQGIDYGFDENNQSISNPLYKKFYQKYIEGIFNPAKRLFVVTVYLPPNILVNYRLNDQIRIGDKIFRINSITTNIVTGKSKIELLNIFSNEIVS